MNWLLVHSTAVDRSGCNHSRDSEDDLEGVADHAEWRGDDGSDGVGRGTENTAVLVWRLGRGFHETEATSLRTKDEELELRSGCDGSPLRRDSW